MHRFATCVCLSACWVLIAAASEARAGVYGGTIESVSSAKIVVKFRSTSKTRSFGISSKTRITLNGRNSSMRKLKPGMQVSITTLSTGRVLRVKASNSSATAPSTTPKPRPRATKPLPSPRATSNPGITVGEWPQFRGPNRDNISAETGLLKNWPTAGPQLAWTAEGFGEGYSAVSIAGGKIFTMGTQGNNQAVFARNLANGDVLWTTPCGPAYREGAGNGPRSTPTVDGDFVYVMGGGGELSCVAAETGRIQWQKNILREFGASNITWGICESVLIDGEKLICTPGGRGATMVALNKQNGNLIWRAAVPGNPQASYASPIVATVGGVKQYVTFTSNAVIGVRANDGRGMWQDTASANGTANCSTPLFYMNHVFSASGYGTGGALLRLSSTRNETAARRMFATSDMKNHHGGMVIIDGYLYGSSDPGILTCIDLRNGNVKWRDRSVGKGSLTYADGCIYLRSEDGPVALVQASPAGYRQLGRFDQPNRSGRKAWAHPVVAAGKLFLRDQDQMFCYRLKGG